MRSAISWAWKVGHRASRSPRRSVSGIAGGGRGSARSHRPLRVRCGRRCTASPRRPASRPRHCRGHQNSSASRGTPPGRRPRGQRAWAAECRAAHPVRHLREVIPYGGGQVDERAGAHGPTSATTARSVHVTPRIIGGSSSRRDRTPPCAPEPMSQLIYPRAEGDLRRSALTVSAGYPATARRGPPFPAP